MEDQQSLDKRLDRVSEELELKVTDIIFNRECGWNAKLKEAIKSTLAKEVRIARMEVESIKTLGINGEYHLVIQNDQITNEQAKALGEAFECKVLLIPDINKIRVLRIPKRMEMRIAWGNTPREALKNSRKQH